MSHIDSRGQSSKTIVSLSPLGQSISCSTDAILNREPSYAPKGLQSPKFGHPILSQAVSSTVNTQPSTADLLVMAVPNLDNPVPLVLLKVEADVFHLAVSALCDRASENELIAFLALELPYDCNQYHTERLSLLRSLWFSLPGVLLRPESAPYLQGWCSGPS